MIGYMYILECADKTYYTGSTIDLANRFYQHETGEGANYTRKRLPVKLVYYEKFDRIDLAFYREKQVQGWSRKKKEALIREQSDRLPELSRNYTQYCLSILRNPVVELAETAVVELAETAVVEPVETAVVELAETAVVEPVETAVVEPVETTLSTTAPSTEHLISVIHTMKQSIGEKDRSAILNNLKSANLVFQKTYPGDKPDRQPVHTLYGGANLFKSDTCVKMGEVALRNLRTYAQDFTVLARILSLEGYQELPNVEKNIAALKAELDEMTEADRKKHPAWLSYSVYNKIIAKLETEAVEDFRIDFEDGFGNRPDAEEDEVAIHAAMELAKGMRERTLSPFIGIRIKPFTEDLKQRGVRTLDLFLTALLTETKGKLPDNFVVMLPKVTMPEHVTALVRLFELIEHAQELPAETLKMEVMVETTQIIMDDEGRVPLMKIIRAAEGRCIAAHFGTYDYTASNGIAAKYQTMSHPVCDFAHYMTKVALGGTGIFLSDGATNVMPIGPHRGEYLTQVQMNENRDTVHHAWRMGFNHTMHSLINGLYQGWDLNPAQLPMRYAATYNFFLSSIEDAMDRLKTFIGRAAVSTLTGDIFDDAATGQGLLNFFLKALNCGAITEGEILETGLTLEEIRMRSFYRILECRKKKG